MYLHQLVVPFGILVPLEDRGRCLTRVCNRPVIAIRRSVIRDCTLLSYAVASLYETVDIPTVMLPTCLEWYSFAYGMYQGISGVSVEALVATEIVVPS
jgi:hypothetical protein